MKLIVLISVDGTIADFVVQLTLRLFFPSSIQNIRMERTWRDIRKDALEQFREVFLHLEEMGLLDMSNAVHRLVLYLVYQPRIQVALDRAKDAWNLHRIRTARNKSPLAIYKLSREKAINRGYWTGDPGDDLDTVNDPDYGCDGDAPLATGENMAGEPGSRRDEPPCGSDEEI